MLPTPHRLTKVRDFNLLIAHGRWVTGAHIAVRVLELAKITNYFPKRVNPNEFISQLRFAIAAGIKVSKKAVDRNRVRRQVREVVHELLLDQQFRHGFFVLIAIKPTLAKKNFAEIRAETILLLRQARVAR